MQSTSPKLFLGMTLVLCALLVAPFAAGASLEEEFLKAMTKTRQWYTEDDAVRWRDDYRCHSNGRIQTGVFSGRWAECNPDSTNFCCSEWGWCGWSGAYCSCSGCTNYRETPTRLCEEDKQFGCGSGGCIPLSHRCDKNKDCSDNSDEENCCAAPFQVYGRHCVLFSDDSLSYEDAEKFCEDRESQVIDFSSLNDLQALVETLATEEVQNMTVRDPREPFWVRVTAESGPNTQDSWSWFQTETELEDPEQESTMIEMEEGASSPERPRCSYLDPHPIATIRHTTECSALKLPVCRKN